MNNLLNCVSDRMLIWRALKTMPFGILLAWSYLSLWMLGAYFTWRAVVKVGWPVLSWNWVFRLVMTSLKLFIILMFLLFLQGIIMPDVYHRPVRDRVKWGVNDVILDKGEMPEPFSGWVWAVRKVSYNRAPSSYWESKQSVRAILRPAGTRLTYEPYPKMGDTFVEVFIAQGKNFYDPVSAWADCEDIYGTQPVGEAWVQGFRSPYACAWRWVKAEWGAVAYWGVYDEFILEVVFEGEAAHYPEAMRRLVELEDEKLGRWVEATRVEPPPRPRGQR